MRTLVQIYDHIPENIYPIIQKNRSWAKKNDWAYVGIHRQNRSHRFVSAWSDLERITYLSKNPYTLFVCWDAWLNIDFNVDLFSNPFKVRDTIIYNHNDTDTFTSALSIYDDYKKKYSNHYLEIHRLYKILMQTGFRKYNTLHRSLYGHGKEKH